MTEAWQALRVAWRARLEQDGLQYFRSSHCQHLRGQFFKFRDLAKYPKPLGRQSADKLQQDLDRIIRDLPLFAVGAIIPIPLWSKFQSDPQYTQFCGKDAYVWAVQTVWMQCTSAMQELGHENVIAFAHDEGNNFAALHDLYKSYKAKNEVSRRRFVGFRPLDDKTNPPIQAADVAATVTYRLALEWYDNPTTAELRRLTESMYRVSVWDEHFAHLVLDNELRKRKASAK